MALRKVNKLKLKNKKHDLSVNKPKRQILKAPSVRAEETVDDDCMIIDDDEVDTTSKRTETVADRNENCPSVEHKEPVDLPSDLKELQRLLIQPLPMWSLADIMKLSDLPVIHSKPQPGEVTREKDEHEEVESVIQKLSPLPQSCGCCIRQRLNYFGGKNFKHPMTNALCDFERTAKYMESNSFEKRVSSEIGSCKGVTLIRNVEAENTRGIFLDDSSVKDISLGRQNNSSQFEKMKRKISPKDKTSEVVEKTAIKHLKLNSGLQNNLSSRTKIELSKKCKCDVKEIDVLGERIEPQMKRNNSSSCLSKSQISVCPLCQVQFSSGQSQLDIDSHIATCLSQAEDDVVW